MPYFSFEYTNKKYVLGLNENNWIWFFDYYFDDQQSNISLPNNGLNILFVFYTENTEIINHFHAIHSINFNDNINNKPEHGLVFFDESIPNFKFKNETSERIATHAESLTYVDVITSQNIGLFDLKLRLLELSYGLIPCFQYNIEHTYESFFSASLAKVENDFFEPKIMKKVFNTLFTQVVLPFVEKHGFQRHTKTSKRLIKKLNEELIIVIYFDHKSFGYGAYESNIVYYENIPNSIEHDDYLASINFNFPYSSNLMISCQNETLLNHELTYWIRIMELYLLPFIAVNNTINAISETLNKHQILEQKRNALGIDKMKRKPAYNFYIPNAKKYKF